MNDSPPFPSRPLKVYAACAKWSLWLLAALWLLLALAWGALQWWILPRIGEWRPALEQRASQALGVPVRIGAVTAHDAGLLPAIEFADIVLLDAAGREALRLPRVVASLSPRSLLQRGFDQLYVHQPDLDVRRTAEGRILVAGLDFSRGDGGDAAADWFFSQGEFVVRGGRLRWTDELHGAPELALSNVEFVVRNTGRRHAIRIDATPPAGWGEPFTLLGVFRQPLFSAHPGRWKDWGGELHANFPRADLAQLRRHVRLSFDIESGHGAVRAWADVDRGRVTGGVADVSAANVSARLGRDLQPLALATLAGRVTAKQAGRRYTLHTQGLQFVTADDRRWPAGDIQLAWQDAEGSRPASGEFSADRLDLGALGELAGRLPLGPATHKALVTYAPRGVVDSLQARWQGPLQEPSSYQAKGRVSDLQVAAVAPTPARAGAKAGSGSPGIRNASAEFELTEAGGKLRLSLADGALELPGVFEDPVLPFQHLSGDIQWQRRGEALTVTANNVRFANRDAQGEAQGSWRTSDDPARRYPGVIELQGTLARADGARVWRYLPLGVPPPAREYVRESVQQADVQDARFRVKGELRDFPFPKKTGEFLVTARVANTTFAFVPRSWAPSGQPQWPALTQLSGQLVFDRGGMRVDGAEARVQNVPGLRIKAQATVPDLANTVVDVTGEIRGPLADALGVVQRTPVAALTQDVLARTTGNGAAEVRLKLSLPVAQIERSRVEGSVILAGNDVQITPDSPMLARARGSVTFTERGFAIPSAVARVYGGDVRIEGGSRSGADEPAVVLRAQGSATAEALRQARELGFLSRIARQATGSAAYNLTLGFRKGGTDVQVQSNLQGLALNLPAPLAKPADAVLPLQYENTLLREGGGEQDQIRLELGRLASVHYVRDVSKAEPRVIRGAVALGLAPGETAVLPEQGVTANAVLGTANVDAWLQAFEPAAGSAPAAPAAAAAAAAPRPAAANEMLGYLPTVLAIRARQLTVEGRTMNNLVVGGVRDGLLWRANVDSQELNGYVEYRQSSSGLGPGRLHARLARLSIGGSSANAVESLLDEQPGNIPTLDIAVDDFELRGRKLGRLEIDALNRGATAVAREGGVREWRLNRLSIATPEATFQATGNWAALDGQSAAAARGRERRRTVMNFRLDIADAGQLLARFGMPDVVRRGKGRMEGQVAWIGSPLAFDYPTMNGSFHVNVEGGQFLKADPGLAKLLGVLSLQSLPRRLALDFRDVFSEGFSFDFVRGDVTIQQGIAATNNLQMKGVNAAVVMEGKADLARETQDLRVLVVPEINAGTASLVAAAINPAIGLGTFLAQLFLREPLARAATQEFQIDGTWADPRVTKVTRTPPADRSTDTRTSGSN
jgi:uncharacterized protein (TIGR02099 family)